MFAFALALGVAMVGAGPASAASGDPLVGLDTAALEAMGAVSPVYSTDIGAWFQPPMLVEGASMRVPGVQGPGAVQLSELYSVPGSKKWTIQAKLRAPAPLRMYYSFNVRAYCSTSATSPDSQATVGSRTDQNGYANSGSDVLVDMSLSSPCSNPARPFLNYVQFDVLTDVTSQGIPATYYTFTWYASRARSPVPYVANPMTSAWCEAMGGAAAGLSGLGPCGFAGGGIGGGVIFPDWPVTEPDGTQWQVACADPPSAEWLSFSWLPGWVGHYASCLVVPKNGWKGQPILDRMNTTALGETYAAVRGLAVGLTFKFACGEIGRADIAGTPMVLTTCNDFFSRLGPVRDVVGWGLMAVAFINGVAAIMAAGGSKYLGLEGGE